MTSTDVFRPDWTSAPGETIVDILEEQNVPLVEFARLMELTWEDAKGLLEGRVAITLATARRLERVLGPSMEFWMSRDYQYREDVAKLNVEEKEWLSEVPVGDMIKFGWLQPPPHPREEVAACLQFFGVSTVAAWRHSYTSLQQMAAFRTSPAFDSKPAAVAAWLRQGEVEADGIECAPWNSDEFRASLPGLRSLTKRRDPRSFVPELQARCAASGVAIAIVRAPSGCRASGSVRFVNPDKGLLQLSFRHLSGDQFWFTFFHEAAHLLLHRERISIVESLRGDRYGIVEGADTLSDSEEEEANALAADILIPSEFRGELTSLPIDQRAVLRFAVRMGVSPGIVVGQLQHLGTLRHDQFNNLKRRYRWPQ